jgi:hypothetical protein
MRVYNQDPAGDMGRRAALAGLPISACPWPEGNWLAERWKASYLAEVARIGKARLLYGDLKVPVHTRGAGRYSPEETDSIQAMLAHGHDASYIARVLKRPLHSVEVKIGNMLKVPPVWSPDQDRDLAKRARRADHPSLKQIAAELGRTAHAVGSRLAHLGIRLNAHRPLAKAAE